MIIGIILSGIFLDVIIAYLGYKQAEKEKIIEAKEKKEDKIK